MGFVWRQVSSCLVLAEAPSFRLQVENDMWTQLQYLCEEGKTQRWLVGCCPGWSRVCCLALLLFEKVRRTCWKGCFLFHVVRCNQMWTGEGGVPSPQLCSDSRASSTRASTPSSGKWKGWAVVFCLSGLNSSQCHAPYLQLRTWLDSPESPSKPEWLLGISLCILHLG